MSHRLSVNGMSLSLKAHRSFIAQYIEQKDRSSRTCKKMFLELDAPPSRKHMSPVLVVVRPRAYAMPALSRVTCFPIVNPILNTSAQNARKPLLTARRICPYNNQHF